MFYFQQWKECVSKLFYQNQLAVSINGTVDIRICIIQCKQYKLTVAGDTLVACPSDDPTSSPATICTEFWEVCTVAVAT